MSYSSLDRARIVGSLVFVAGTNLAISATPAVTPATFLEPISSWGDALVGSTQIWRFQASALFGPVTVHGVTLSGPSASSYSIVGNTCINGLVITDSIRCEVDVQFSPQQLGNLSETLTLTSTVAPDPLDISASGLATPLLLSPTSIDFGFQAIGTTSAARTLTITNPNPVPISLSYDYYGILGNGFYETTKTCGTIPANGSCSYQVTFTPPTEGVSTGDWYVVTSTDGSEFKTTDVKVAGIGVQDGAAAVDLMPAANVDGISYENVPTPAGGLDSLGNAYANNFLAGGARFSGQTFYFDSNQVNAVSAASIPLPAGRYYGVTLLGTAVRGNQPNQVFTVTYSDGTSAAMRQSLSDWKTPQHYQGESLALPMPYRLDSNGLRHPGPYNLYAYTLPFDPTKTAVSVRLPANRSVVIVAMNTEVAGVPVTADLSTLYNVTALGVDGQPVTGGGIDGLGSAISLHQFDSVPLSELLLAVPPYNVLDAVGNVTVPLPGGQFSTLHLDGLGVRGNHDNQTLIVNYEDRTSTVVRQGFSDWHTSQGYPHESIAVAMTAKLNPDGSTHPGTYNVYQYDIPIDSTKRIQSVTLPKTAFVVFLSVALKP
jgi:hypothetical protein